MAKQRGGGGEKLFKGSSAQFRVLYRAAVERVLWDFACKTTPARTQARWNHMAFRLHACCNNIDAHGRWAQTRTATVYIDAAIAAVFEGKLTESGKNRLADSPFVSRKC